MNIELQSDTLEKFSDAEVKSLGFVKKDFLGRHSTASIDLFGVTEKQFNFIFEKLENHSTKTKEVKQAIATMKRCREVMAGKSPKAANTASGKEVLEAYIAGKAPRFRVYLQSKQQWFGFFVDNIQQIPASQRSGEYYPAELRLHVTYSQWGDVKRTVFTWGDHDCRGKTAAQLLMLRGLFIENDEIREHYEQSKNRYFDLMMRIGLQCYASGTGFENSYREEPDCSGVNWHSSTIDPCIKGKPTTVVIDYPNDKIELTLSESLAYRRTSNCRLSEIHAKLLGKGVADPFYIPANEDEIEDDEAIDASKNMTVPIHPLLPVYDLRRHTRYAIHASDLKEYVYDDLVADKLVLPAIHKQIIEVLVNSKGDEFTDLVDNKSGGTTVLLAGKPGVGKTLSAEVFAERTHRPLYRVQCSQLGVDPDTIEGELEVVFKRAHRWNAVILLDEADIYIAKRGDDLERNAIVCVFLRVLEYQTGVLFMTTNLPETVDDAIASRCIARIDIERPGTENLKLIWKTLLASTGLSMPENDIVTLSQKYHRMGGRDVKAAIKLGMIHSQEISLPVVEFVLAFHPNRGEWGQACNT